MSNIYYTVQTEPAHCLEFVFGLKLGEKNG